MFQTTQNLFELPEFILKVFPSFTLRVKLIHFTNQQNKITRADCYLVQRNSDQGMIKMVRNFKESLTMSGSYCFLTNN